MQVGRRSALEMIRLALRNPLEEKYNRFFSIVQAQVVFAARHDGVRRREALDRKCLCQVRARDGNVVGIFT